MAGEVARGRPVEITFPDAASPRRKLRPDEQRDREQAFRDLRANAHVVPAGVDGPFRLELRLHAGRLLIGIAPEDATTPIVHALSLASFRRLIKDYRMILDTHDHAASGGSVTRLHALDLARRAVHDEAADALIDALWGLVELDRPTARRIFTLLCCCTGG